MLQIQSLESEIEEKQTQMRALELQIAQIAEPGVDKASLLELQHVKSPLFSSESLL